MEIVGSSKTFNFLLYKLFYLFMPTDKPHIKVDNEKLNTTPDILAGDILSPKETSPIAPTETQVINQEILINPEQTPQTQPEDENFLEDTIESLKQTLKGKKKPTQIPLIKDEVTVQIEKIMENDLAGAYSALTPIQKQEFKIKGEETAWKIRHILQQTHVRVKEIFKLLLAWLKMLPGINKFFLEQEAKIKTDKIISLHENNKHQN